MNKKASRPAIDSAARSGELPVDISLPPQGKAKRHTNNAPMARVSLDTFSAADNH